MPSLIHIILMCIVQKGHREGCKRHWTAMPRKRLQIYRKLPNRRFPGTAVVLPPFCGFCGFCGFWLWILDSGPKSGKKRPKKLCQTKKQSYFCPGLRKVAGVIDRGGLEIRCTACPYRGFESLTFRKNPGQQAFSLACCPGSLYGQDRTICSGHRNRQVLKMR